MDSAVFALVPEFARASVDVVLTGSGASAALGPYAARVAERVGDPEPDTEWRDAYRRLGFPDDVPPPHEALRAWAHAAGHLPSQGAALDLVNAFSLVARTPAAAYAIDEAAGGLWLRPARGHEQHEALSGEWSAPPMGELILADGEDHVLARHWHGGQGRAFVPGPGTRRVRFHVDVLAASPYEEARRVGDDLARLAAAMLRGIAFVQVLHAASAVIHWSDQPAGT